MNIEDHTYIALRLRGITPASPDILDPPAAWMDDAACTEHSPDVWFPDTGGSVAMAKRICRSCPVTTQCLTFALDNNERYGVYGGLSEKERRRINPNRSIA